MLSEQHQKFLRTNILFSEFTDSEFLQASKMASLSEVTDQQYLFEQGQVARDFFLLIDGKIKLAFLSAEGGEKVVNIVQTGASFAEAPMFFKQRKYPVSASALGDSKVLRVNADNYLKALEKSPKSCFSVMGKLSQRLHWAMSEINHLVLHDGKYRLINFLLTNALQQKGKPSNVDLFVPKNILASQLSIKPETLSRILKELSEQNLIKVKNKHIALLKPLELKNIIN